MNIVYRQSPNKSSRNGWKPDMIVCHITDGNYEGAVSWLCNPVSQASSHFVVSRKGEVSQLVDLREMAWVNGTSITLSDKRYYGKSTSNLIKSRKTNANYYTIGIETEGFSSTTRGALTDIQKQTVIELIKHIKCQIKEIYGTDIILDREHIIGHYEVTPITKPNCPGKLFPFDEIIKELNYIKKDNNEIIDTGKFKINNNIYEIDRILKDDTNYIKLSDLKKAGFTIEYDKKNNLPIINSPMEKIETIKVKINDQVIDMNRILKDNRNYIKLSDFSKADFEVYYDEKNDLPIVNTRR